MAATKNTAEAWERRTLGASEDHVAVADDACDQALEEALGMQSISIRLPQQLIKHYKLIAQAHGVGYQPLMRDVLTRFVPDELKRVLAEEGRKAQQAAEAVTGATEPLKKAA